MEFQSASRQLLKFAASILVPLFSIAYMTSCEQPAGGPPGTPIPIAESRDFVSAPPLARVEPTELQAHGDVRVDEYYWLRERTDPEVVDYLEAENVYTAAATAHTAELREALYEELVGRIRQDDESVPYREGSFWYYTRYEVGGNFPLYCRRAGSPDGPEEILLNANERSAGHEFYAVSGLSVSSDEDVLAFAEDTVGRRRYTISFKDLKTGKVLEETIEDVTSNVVWANDNRTLFYTRQDPATLRWYQVYRHTLGTDPSGDVLVYEEKDEEFSSYVFKSKSKAYLFISSEQTLSSEVRFLRADDPTGRFAIVQPREDRHEYEVDHFGDAFYVRTNLDAENFRLMQTPTESPGKSHWTEVIPHRDDTYLAGFEIFRGHLVLTERSRGLIQLRVRSWDGTADYYVDFGEPAYLAYASQNPEYDTEILRFGYSSMTTPPSTFDFDMNTKERTLLKETEVLGGFEKSNYVTERKYATARDGTEIPVSLVYRKSTRIDGTAPLLLYGYGSYGASIDASFSSSRLSLLDRGFVYGIAHIRGGQEMGRRWYEDGKLLRKKNTFTDFIDVAEFLVQERYAASARLFAQGGSAGGLLMGAVVNMQPELWRGVVAQVPFVDVVTTMLDDSIPLTTSEYDEWGNPNEKEYYDYILSYSPYDNVGEQAYPNMLVTTGLHDSQVQYWEPAKWVARLRARKTDDNLLLLKTNMEAGHGGASGRLKQLRETAFVYGYLLDLAGVSSIAPVAH